MATAMKCFRSAARDIVILCAIAACTTTVAQTARCDGGVQLSDQEIRDMMRWGIEHNRTPEDIREDINGLNQARGGSGTVPLPTELESIETPAGRVTTTQQEAERYRQNQGREDWLRGTAEFHKNALKTLEKESGKWARLAQLAEWRAAAAYTQMQEAYGDLQADLLLIKAKILATNRKPTRSNFGWAYKDYETLSEAINAWEHRQDKLDALHAERAQVQSEFVDKIQKMTDPDPESTEGTSMLNRPNAELDEIGEWQDFHRERIIEAREEIAGLIEEREGLERRAAGSGGPPPVIPEPEPRPEQPPGTPPATAGEGTDGDTTSTGDGDGESGGTWGGYPPVVRGDGDSTRTTGGSGDGGRDGGSGTSGRSVGDMLREFGDDDEDGGDGGGTVTAGEELLVGIQSEFDNAFAELEQCRYDFDGRLASLAGADPEVICTDPGLAASYSCLQSNYERCADLYAEAHATLTRASLGRRWDKMGMESDVMSEDESGINPMDQITITLINTKYQSASGAYGQSRDQLYATAPGCDPDDLTRRTGETAGTGEGTGDGGSGTGGTGGSGGGGWTDGDGGGSGGTGGTGEVVYRKLGAPNQTGPGGGSASCSGGGLRMQLNSIDYFPEEIDPGRTYNITVNLTWSASGVVADLDIGVVVTFVDPAKSDARKYSSYASNKPLNFSFNSSEISFNQPGAVITVGFGGSVDCGETTAELPATVITQAYERVTR